MPFCRFCNTSLNNVVIDLGASPLSNSYVPQDKYMAMEPYYPLKVYYCSACGLLQLEEFTSPSDIFSEYDYFSSFSDTWVEHARHYAEHMISDYGINKESQIVEIASNDGYLLQHFLKKGIKVLGVEPAKNVAQVARNKGIPTQSFFFGEKTAHELIQKGYAADLALGNNVLAHVPDINDFVEGFYILLKPDGFMTVEFPHVLNFLKETQFDTIYHEHFSYFSLATVQRIFDAHDLRVFHVEKLRTHGGSLRVFACHKRASWKKDSTVEALLSEEYNFDLTNITNFENFAQKSLNIKLDLLEFLIKSKREGKIVCGYGAAAKGNTLLNYAGIRHDMISVVADRSPYKQGKYLPGSRIPVVSPSVLLEERPDYVLILPWNIKDEIMNQLSIIHQWGGKFVTAIPQLKVW